MQKKKNVKVKMQKKIQHVKITIIYVKLCQKPSGRKLKVENKDLFSTVLFILSLASHNVEK